MRQIWFKKPQRGTSEQEAPMLGIFPRQMMWPDQAVAAQFSGEAAYLSGVRLVYWPFCTLEDAVFPVAPPTGPFRILVDESADCFVVGPLRDD